MCLITTSEPIKNKKAFIAYKYGFINKENQYVSPYKQISIDFNKVTHDIEFENIQIIGKYKIINEGFFHFYIDNNYFRCEKDKLLFTWYKNIKVPFNATSLIGKLYKIIIPKGAVFYKEFNNGFRACTKDIIIINFDNINFWQRIKLWFYKKSILSVKSDFLL